MFMNTGPCSKLRAAHPAAEEPKGLRLWKMFAKEMKVQRSVDSLCTRWVIFENFLVRYTRILFLVDSVDTW